jgi:hypothetical protein
MATLITAALTTSNPAYISLSLVQALLLNIAFYGTSCCWLVAYLEKSVNSCIETLRMLLVKMSGSPAGTEQAIYCVKIEVGMDAVAAIL